MSRPGTTTAPAEPALTLAPQWDATLRDLAALIEDVAEWGDDQLAIHAPPTWVAQQLIDAGRLIAKAVTP